MKSLTPVIGSRWLFVCTGLIVTFSLDSIVVSELVAVLKDIPLHMDLNISNCSDGASNMAVIRNGVSSQISAEESRVFFCTMLWACPQFSCWRLH